MCCKVLAWWRETGTPRSAVTGSVANTTDGSTPITAATDITTFTDTTSNIRRSIAISGTAHDGTAVSSTNFAITPTTTVGDLLNEIDGLFGNVTASLTSDGKILVIDNATGTSKLSVNISASLTGANPGVLSFGTFGTAGTVQNAVLQQGADASFTVDGVNMTSSTNTVTTAIQGVTLNLVGADPNTTLTVNVDPDTQGIEAEINTMVSAYNGVMSYINAQMSYNTQSNSTGGVLFGNTTLTTIKSQLQSSILAQVGTGSYDYLQSNRNYSG